MLSTFAIGSTTILSPTLTNYFLHYPIEGLDAPTRRIAQYDKPGEDGAVISTAYYGMRLVSLNGVILGTSPAQYEQNRLNLIAAVGVNRDNAGAPALTTFSFTTVAGNSYFFYGYPKDVKFAIDAINRTVFKIDIYVPAPQIYSGAQQNNVLTPPTGGGFTVPHNVPVVSSASSGGSVTAVNNGTMTSFPLVILKGVLTNPYIYNQTLGRYVQLTYTTGANDTIVIDMANKLMTLNNSSSVLPYRAQGSDWWGIAPGSNLITLSTGLSSDTGNVTIQFYNAVVGV